MKLKSVFVLILSYGIITSLFAQDQPITKNYLLGGSISFQIQKNSFPSSSIGIGPGFYSQNNDNLRYLTFSFSPQFGKQISEKWLVGILGNLSLSRYENNNSQGTTLDFDRNSIQYGGGIFGRYTINPENLFNFFIEPNIEYYLFSLTVKQNSVKTEEQKANFIKIRTQLGGLYRISPKFNLSAKIGGLDYVNGHWEIVGTKDDKNFSSFYSSFNLANLFFGFEWKF